MINAVTVYCASSPNIDQHYFDAASQLAEILVKNNVTIVYGGGSTGLMGQVADTAIQHKGHVIGIIPEFMEKIEWGHNGISELRIVGDMHERKKKMADAVDAVIALPGGCGTMEELLEVITWKRLGIFTKPIIIINTKGYYEPLIAMLKKSIEEKFMGGRHKGMWKVINTPEMIMEAIEQSEPWDKDAIKFAKD
ncbi:MAG: TIGR00730 family Rossman fold protein [Bacteroidota bacterium]